MGFDPDRPAALPPTVLGLAEAIIRLVSSMRWRILSEDWTVAEPHVLARRVWQCLRCKRDREVIGPGRPGECDCGPHDATSDASE